MRTLWVAVASLAVSGSSFAEAPKKGGGKDPKGEAKSAEPEFKVVEVTVEEDIKQSGVRAAEDRALQKALTRAVDQIVGTYVTSFSEAKDSTILQDMVSTHTTGYVRKYDIVNKKVDEEGGVLSLSVKAEVAKAEIDKDAAAVATIIAMKKQKRIYVMVPDILTEVVGQAKGGGGGQAIATRHGVFDALIRERLRTDGFFTLDPNFVDGKLKVKAAVTSLNSPQEAMEIANAVGADLIIYGSASASQAEPLPAMAVITSAARVALTCVSPDSAEVIADHVETGNGMDTVSLTKATTLAFDKLATSAINSLRGKFYNAWKKNIGSGQRVVMSVTGVRDYGTINDFKNVLSNNVSGVKGVSSVKLDNGNASMDISYTGNTDGLAGELDGKVVKGKKISVTKVTSNTIEVALGK
jgi:hypothetical protein